MFPAIQCKNLTGVTLELAWVRRLSKELLTRLDDTRPFDLAVCDVILGVMREREILDEPEIGSL